MKDKISYQWKSLMKTESFQIILIMCWTNGGLHSWIYITRYIQPHPCNFDDPLSLSEVRSAIFMANCGKAPGIDCIPMEALRNETIIICLCKLFNKCYSKGIVPTSWSKAIVNPIPKSSTSDSRNPLQYRGISLAASMYKVYCSVLNERLTSWAEVNNIVHDEQNGFRKGRSTIDHIHSLTSSSNRAPWV